LATFQKSKQHALTAVDYDILKLIAEYHFLTVSQVTRLRYSSGSGTTCQDRLKGLFHAGVLDRVQLPHVGTGNTQYLYTLSTKGQKELQELGIASFSRFRPSDTHTLKLPHLQHLISLNDFLIAARLLCREHPDITLVSVKHDLDMKREPMRVTLDRQVFTIVPDGFLNFRLSIAGRLYAMPIWLELDRGTTWGNTLTLKLQKIISAIQTLAFQELFGVSSVTVAIGTTDKKRVDLMRSFIQTELQRLGVTHLSPVFLVTSLADGLLDPKEIFLSPLWYTPDTTAPLPLLDLSEE
jgi:hypothetical protein